MLNLNETADLHYRYKMPKIEARVESRGNGIKTAVLNLAKVANSLSRPPSYLLKFFSYELGCVSDETETRYIINGSHQPDRIQALVYSFIKKYVLCSSCSNPETNIVNGDDLTILGLPSNRVSQSNKKNFTAKLLCTACGSTTSLDMSHKLTSYIIKNPPDPKYIQVTTNLASKKPTSECEEQDKAQKLEDEKKLVEDMKNLLVQQSKTDTLEDKLRDFEQFLADSNLIELLQSSESKITPTDLKKMMNFSITNDIRPYVTLVLTKYIFKINNSVTSETPLTLMSCITNNWKSTLQLFHGHHQPSQLNFLAGLEEILCMPVASASDSKPGAHFSLKSVQKFFLWLYNEDLIDAESFITWFQRLCSTPCPENLDKLRYQELEAVSKPFIEWISESDSEDDEEEENLHLKTKSSTHRSLNDNQQADKYLSTSNMAAKLATMSASGSTAAATTEGQMVNQAKSVLGSNNNNNEEESDIDIDDI